MSDEKSVAEALAKMSQTTKKAPPPRFSGHASQPTNKNNSNPEDNPPVNKCAKKASSDDTNA